MALAVPAAPALVGSPTPRIGVLPVGDASRGAEAIEFIVDVLQIDLFPWQRYALDAACRTDDDGKWRYRTCLTLVARQNGKTELCAGRILAGLMLFGERLIIGASQSRDISLETLRRTVEIAEDAKLPIKKILRSTGSEELILDVGGRDARFKIVTASPGSGRGLSADCVILDEVRQYRSEDVWGALDRTRRARPTSQVFAVSTEGDMTSVVLNRLKEQGRQAAATGDPARFMYAEWSAHPDRDPTDRQGWAESNPSLGHLLSEETLADEQATDTPEVFERESLCRSTLVSRPWLALDRWAGCEDPSASVPDDARVVFGIDARPDLSSVSIAVAWLRPDDRVHVEAVATFTAAAPAESRLAELVARWQPLAVAVASKGAVEALAQRVCTAAGTEMLAVGPTDADRASRSFYEQVTSGRLVHPPDVVLADHLAGAQLTEPGLFARRSPVPIDAAVAAVLACWAAGRLPVAAVPTWVAF